MASSMKGFEHLEIQLEEIKSATNNFNEENVIGHGGFGKVYKGELSHSHSTGKSLVALKRLNRKLGQGDAEFHKEVRMLSCYRHENIISLLGFSRGWDEMILVYEYASRGSLDGYLKDVNLTWTQRLKICLDAAKGLSYLHDPRETYQRLIHCDIKSANILLDENFNAKVSDFGLSKIGPANQQNSILVTGALGTFGYCDPLFMETYSLTKESDVYSFGVVLFEVLSGKLCFEFSNGQLNVLVPMWKQSYEENKLDEIIMQDIRQQMDPSSLKTFSYIAFQCLRKARDERPTMSRVVEELEIALDSQEFPDLRLEVLTKWESVLKAVDPLLIYKTGKQLKELLSKGCLITNEGKTWLSMNEKGEHIEKIYIQACFSLYQIETRYLEDPSDYGIVNSRFPGGKCYNYYYGFEARVRGEYLTPQISYTLNLVFRYEHQSKVNSYNPLRYKIDGEAKVFIINPSIHEREDGWFIVPLYHFTTQHSTADLQFQFENRWINLLVVGMVFQPSEEKVQLPVFEEYQHIVEAASQSLFYTSLDELKQILSQGVYLNGYKTWFSLNEKGQHCHMISMEDCLIPNEDSTPPYNSHPLSRFPAGFYQTYNKGFKTHVKTQLLSPSITYTVNLVFCHALDGKLKYRLRGETTTSTVNLANLRKVDEWLCYQYGWDGFKARVRGEYLTPQISYTLNLVFLYEDQSAVNSYTPLRYKIDGEAKVFIVYPSYMREDGWFIAPLYHFTSQHSTADLQFDFEEHRCGLLVAGFEFQPSGEKVQLPLFEEYQHIVEAASQSLLYTSLDELKQILSKGVYLNRFKTLFSINEKGQHCHMISMKDCLIPNEDSTPRYESDCRSRFPAGFYKTKKKGLKTHTKTQLLSPSITYTVNLVCKISSYDEQVYVDLKYKLRGEATTSVVYHANKIQDDGLHMIELYQFTSDGSIVDLEIIFEENYGTKINRVEGILFQPLEIVEDQVSNKDKVENIQTVSYSESESESETYWEQKLPNDYEKILNLSKYSLRWTTKKELYSILRRGFLLDNGQQWYNVDKHGKKCTMLSARGTWVMEIENSVFVYSRESRFGEVLVMTSEYWFGIEAEITSEPGANYVVYLVYKLPQDQSTFEAPIQVSDINDHIKPFFIYLVSPPHTPVIGPKFEENTYNPLNRYKGNAIPQQRTDGWMEVKVWEFQTTTKTEHMNLSFSHPGEKDLKGLMIQGIELRPK